MYKVIYINCRFKRLKVATGKVKIIHDVTPIILVNIEVQFFSWTHVFTRRVHTTQTVTRSFCFYFFNYLLGRI